MADIVKPRWLGEFPAGSIGRFNAEARQKLAELATPESYVRLELPAQGRTVYGKEAFNG